MPDGFRIADAYVNVDVDQAKLARAITEANAALDQLKDRSVGLDIDQKKFAGAILAARKQLEALSARASITPDIDQKKVDAALALVAAKAGKLRGQLNIIPDSGEVRDRLAQITALVKGMRENIQIGADPRELSSDMAKIVAQMKVLADVAGRIDLGINERKIDLAFLDVKAKLEALGEILIHPKINQAELDTELAAVKAQMEAIIGEFNIHVNLEGMDKAFAQMAAAVPIAHQLADHMLKFQQISSGLGGVGGGIGGGGGRFWWTQWAHWIIAGGSELASVVVPAAVALGSAMVVAAQGAQQVEQHMKAQWTAAEATNKYLHQTFGQTLGFKNALQQAQNAADPKVYQAVGAALNIAKSHAMGLANVGLTVVNIFDKFLAHMQFSMTTGGGAAALKRMFEEMVPDLVSLGQIFGNLGHAVVNLAAAMPGLAQGLLMFLNAVSRVILAISSLPTWILTTVMVFEEFYRWGGLAAVILGKLSGLFESGGLAVRIYTKYMDEFRVIVGFLPMVAGRAIAGIGLLIGKFATTGSEVAKVGTAFTNAGTKLTGFASTLTGPMALGIAVGVAALATLIIYLARTQTATEKWISSAERAVAAASSMNALSVIEGKLTGVATQLAFAHTTLSNVVRHSGDVSNYTAGRYDSLSAKQIQARQSTDNLRAAHQRLVGSLNNVVQGAGMLASLYHTTFIGALQLATNAGVKLQNGILGQGQAATIARIQVADYVAGLKAMGTPMGAIGTDMNALAIQSGLAATKVSQLNSAWDDFMNNVTGGTNSFSQFQLAMQGLGQTALKNTASLKGTISSIDLVKKSATTSTTAANGFATSLKGLGQNAAQTWQQFNSVITGPGQQMLDWLRTAGAEGQLTGRDFTTAVRAMIAQLLPMAAHSKTATAELSAMAQQAGGPFTTNFKTLKAWVDQGHHSMGQFGKIVDNTTQKMANMSQVAQDLGTSMRNNIIQTMTASQLKTSGLSGAVSSLTDYINRNGKAGIEQSGIYQRVHDILTTLTGSTTEATQIEQAYIDKIGAGNTALQGAHDKLQASRDMQKEYNKAIVDGHPSNRTLITDLANIGIKAGLSKDDIAKMITKITGIPPKTVWNIIMHGAGDFHISQVAKAHIKAEGPFAVSPVANAAGGPITRGTTGTADDVLMYASKGEWVIRESSASRYGPQAMSAVNAGTAVIGYAAGGPILQGAQSVLSGGAGVNMFHSFVDTMSVSMINMMHAALRKAEIAAQGVAGWPFPTKSMSQLRRIDEGQDMQYPGTAVVPIHAILPGRVVILGPDPGGFGNAYPGEILDSPVAGFKEIYYGHVFPNAGISGKHVNVGDVIAHTGGTTSGGDAAGLSNWLELGFWPPSWANGHLMHDLLMGRLRATGRGGGPVPTGSWTARGLRSLWMQAGGSPGLAHTMSAIALAESGGNPRAHNPSGASGLWQIMMPMNAGYVPGGMANVYVPIDNAIAAVRIADGGRNLRAWTTYTSGAYLQFYGAGTSGAAPGWGVVGEMGPEFVKFHGGEQVVPMRGGMGGHPGYAGGTPVAGEFCSIADHGKHRGGLQCKRYPDGRWRWTHPSVDPTVGTSAHHATTHHTSSATLADVGASAAGAFVGLTTTAEEKRAFNKLVADLGKYFSGHEYAKRYHLAVQQEKHLHNAVAQLASINSRIASAKSYQSGVLSSLSGYADLSGMMVGSGYVGSTLMSGGSFLNWQLQQKLGNLKKFASVLKQLGQKHVNTDLIKQVVAMGPDAGTQFGEEILNAGPSVLKALGATEAAITAEEKTVANIATSSAYGVGGTMNWAAALKKQRSAIEKEVQHWARVFGTEAGRWFGTPTRRLPKKYQTGGTIPMGDVGIVGEAGIEHVTATPFGAVVEPVGGTGGPTVIQNFYGPQYPTPEQRRCMAVEMTLALGVAP